MVRADLDCPDGQIEYIGGMGTSDQVLIRTLTACGTFTTYRWSEDGTWARKAP